MKRLLVVVALVIAGSQALAVTQPVSVEQIRHSTGVAWKLDQFLGSATAYLGAATGSSTAYLGEAIVTAIESSTCYLGESVTTAIESATCYLAQGLINAHTLGSTVYGSDLLLIQGDYAAGSVGFPTLGIRSVTVSFIDAAGVGSQCLIFANNVTTAGTVSTPVAVLNTNESLVNYPWYSEGMSCLLTADLMGSTTNSLHVRGDSLPTTHTSTGSMILSLPPDLYTAIGSSSCYLGESIANSLLNTTLYTNSVIYAPPSGGGTPISGTMIPYYMSGVPPYNYFADGLATTNPSIKQIGLPIASMGSATEYITMIGGTGTPSYTGQPVGAHMALWSFVGPTAAGSSATSLGPMWVANISYNLANGGTGVAARFTATTSSPFSDGTASGTRNAIDVANRVSAKGSITGTRSSGTVWFDDVVDMSVTKAGINNDTALIVTNAPGADITVRMESATMWGINAGGSAIVAANNFMVVGGSRNTGAGLKLTMAPSSLAIPVTGVAGTNNTGHQQVNTIMAGICNAASTEAAARVVPIASTQYIGADGVVAGHASAVYSVGACGTVTATRWIIPAVTGSSQFIPAGVEGYTWYVSGDNGATAYVCGSTIGITAASQDIGVSQGHQVFGSGVATYAINTLPDGVSDSNLNLKAPLYWYFHHKGGNDLIVHAKWRLVKP